MAYDALTKEEKAYVKDRVVSIIRSLFYESERAIPEGPFRVIQVQESIKPEDLLNTIETAAEKCAERLLSKVKAPQSKISRKDLEEVLDLVREVKGLLEHELPMQLQSDKTKYAGYYKSKLQSKLAAALEKLLEV